MKFSKNYLSMAALALCTLGITGCQDYEPFTMEEVRKGGFEQNFLTQYGKFMEPGMSWDLSATTRRGKYDADDAFGFVFGESAIEAQTRSYVPGTDSYSPVPGCEDIQPDNANYGTYVTKERYYDVQASTLSWMKEHLVEQRNNTGYTNPFYMRMPDQMVNGGHLVIIPIYQGNAVMRWDLHLVAGGKDINLWSRHEGVRVQTNELRDEEDKNKWANPVELGERGTMDALNINSRVIDVTMADVLAGTTNRDFYFYLDITMGHVKSAQHGEPQFWNDYAWTYAKQKSTEGMMVVLPCETPTNLGTTENPVNAFLLGCEDADLYPGSDWDVNDVVFLVMTGEPNTPILIEGEKHKRYMCEDLGNTYDFDFNDVVVDAWEYQEKYYQNGQFVAQGDPKQRIVVKHLGGTNPIQVQVGNKTFSTITDPVNQERTMDELKGETAGKSYQNSDHYAGEGWDPDFEVIGSKREIGWVPERNNITLHAWSKRFNPDGTPEENTEVFTVEFPDNSRPDAENKLIVPQIIAVDPTLNWMPEHQQIPEDWFVNGNYGNKVVIDGDEGIEFNHTNLLTIGGETFFTARGYQMNADDKVTLIPWNDLTYTYSAKTTQKPFDGNSFQLGYNNPNVALLPGKYDFKVTLESDNANLKTVRVIVIGDDKLGGNPEELWVWPRPEMSFSKPAGKKSTFQGTLDVPADIYPYGLTFAVVVDVLDEEVSTISISNPYLQRHDADDITEPTPRPEPNTNILAVPNTTTGHIWHSSWGEKVSNKIPYQLYHGHDVELDLNSASTSWNHAVVGFNVPDVDLSTGKYEYSFDINTPTQLNSLSVKLGGGNHIFNTNNNNQANFDGNETPHNNLALAAGTHTIKGDVSMPATSEHGFSLAILIQNTAAGGLLHISNVRISKVGTDDYQAPAANLLGGQQMHYSTRGLRMANEVGEADYNGQYITMKSKTYDGWSNPWEYDHYQFGVYAPQVQLQAKTYNVQMTYNASDDFGWLEFQVAGGKHCGIVENLWVTADNWSSDWGVKHMYYNQDNYIAGTQGEHTINFNVTIPADKTAGDGVSLMFFVMKVKGDGYQNTNKSFDFTVKHLFLTEVEGSTSGSDDNPGTGDNSGTDDGGNTGTGEGGGTTTPGVGPGTAGEEDAGAKPRK